MFAEAKELISKAKVERSPWVALEICHEVQEMLTGIVAQARKEKNQRAYFEAQELFAEIQRIARKHSERF